MTTIEKLKTLKSSDILLLCGELTAGELRTVKAFRDWVVRSLENEAPSKTEWAKHLNRLESDILDSIHSRCPKDSSNDRSALSQLNQLEKEEEQAITALDCLRAHIQTLY